MHLQELKKSYGLRQQEIRNRIAEFEAEKSKDAVFEELCFCLLTPQSNAQRCWQIVQNLKQKKLLYAGSYEQVTKELTGTRFHRTKAKYLFLARDKFDEIYKELKNNGFSCEKSSIELREWLVKNVKGYGYKEASHFMRNIGCKDVSILDRHILRFMLKLKFIDEMPKTLTRKKYIETEKKLFTFAESTGIHHAELDLLIWSMQTGKVFK